MSKLREEIKEEWRKVNERLTTLEKNLNEAKYVEELGPSQYNLALEEMDILSLYIRLLERRYADSIKSESKKEARGTKKEYTSKSSTVRTEPDEKQASDIIEAFNNLLIKFSEMK